MKALAAFLLALVLSGSASAAPVNTATTATGGSRAAIRSVTQLKKLKMPPPRMVKSAGMAPADIKLLFQAVPVRSGTSEGSSAYRTGEGVVFRPGSIVDSSTRSSCVISSVRLCTASKTAICNPDFPNSCVQLSFVPTRENQTSFFWAEYRQVPGGLHTYVITLRMVPITDPEADVRSCLRMVIGDQTYEGSAIVENRETGEYSVLFTYDPAGAETPNTLVVGFVWTRTSYRLVSFYHVQLAQIG